MNCVNYRPLSQKTSNQRTSPPSLASFIKTTLPSQMTPSLINHSLSACYLNLPPYIHSTPPAGIAITYLNNLQSRINFSTTLTKWHSTPNSLLHALTLDPPPCHLAIAPFAITDSRMQKNTFLWPFASESHRMVQSKAALVPPSTPWFIFHTFSPDVWFLLLLGIILHAIGTIVYANPQDRSFKCDTLRSGLVGLPTAFVRAYAHFIGNPFAYAMQTPSFHRAAWLLLGLTSGIFLLTVYEASLTVLLFESVRESQFGTMEDVKHCVINPHKVAMVAGSSSQEFWNFAVNVSSTRDLCAWSVAGVTLPSFERAFDSLTSGDVDYFFDLEGAVLARAYKQCGKYEVVGEPFFFTQVAFAVSSAVPKETVDALSRETRLLREADAFPTANVLAAHIGCDERAAATVTGANLSAFFGMYVCLWALLLGYRCVFLRRKLKEENEEQGETQLQDVATSNEVTWSREEG